jgi:hypothetical protein
MNRRSTIFIAVGAATAAVLLATPADAQSGHALVLAEKACFDQGIRPNTAAFDQCVDRLVAPDHVPNVNMAFSDSRCCSQCGPWIATD